MQVNCFVTSFYLPFFLSSDINPLAVTRSKRSRDGSENEIPLLERVIERLRDGFGRV